MVGVIGLTTLIAMLTLLSMVGWVAIIGYTRQTQQKLKDIGRTVERIRTTQLEAEQFGTALPTPPTVPRHRLQVRIGSKQLVDIITEQPAQVVDGAVSRTQHRERGPFLWE